MINEILIIVGLTFIPFLELRASIPYGILALKMNWLSVFIIAVTSNIILGMIIYFCLDKFLHIALKIKIIEKLYQKTVEKTQKKIHDKVEKYGTLGVAIFIGVPLPGSGVYSGALGSFLLGMSYKRFLLANIVGVLIAGIAVTIITLTGSEAFSWMLKII